MADTGTGTGLKFQPTSQYVPPKIIIPGPGGKGPPLVAGGSVIRVVAELQKPVKAGDEVILFLVYLCPGSCAGVLALQPTPPPQHVFEPGQQEFSFDLQTLVPNAASQLTIQAYLAVNKTLFADPEEEVGVVVTVVQPGSVEARPK